MTSTTAAFDERIARVNDELVSQADPFKQGDAADAAFAAWYDVAKLFAQGKLSADEMRGVSERSCGALLVQQAPTFLTNPNTDDYVVRNLVDNFVKMLALHCEKPKFRALLLPPPDDNSFVRWLRDVAVPKLASLASLVGVSETNRVHYLRALQALVRVENELRRTDVVSPSPTPPSSSSSALSSSSSLPSSLRIAEHHLPLLLTIAVNVNHGQLYRAAAFDVLRLLNDVQLRRNNAVFFCICVLSCSLSFTFSITHTRARPTLRMTRVALGQLAADSVALAELWAPPYLAIAHTSSVEQLSRRVALSRANGSSGATASGLATHRYCAAQAGGGALDDELLDSLAHAINNKHIDVARHEREVAQLLRVCDRIERGTSLDAVVGNDRDSGLTSIAASDSMSEVVSKGNVGSGNDEFEDIEHSSKTLEALAAALRERPSSVALLRVALSPPTVASLGLIQAFANDLDESTWTELVLPTMQRHIAAMALGGVSGKRFEQEVVDVVREASRALYVNRSTPPGSEHTIYYFF